MKNQPKISVIIPVYNVEKYLRECLDSVVNQTLRDIEIICVNDGSIDNSLSILEQFYETDDRFLILDQSNRGAGKTRNIAMDLAKGEYLIFMDPDDYYPSEDILEVLYNKAKEYGVQICGGSISQLYQGVIQKNFSGLMKDYTFSKNRLMKYDEYQYDYGYTRFIYNKEFLKEEKIYFPEYRRFNDPPFFVRAMIAAGQFYSIKKITYCHRVGYKKQQYDKEKTMDLLRGLVDNLVISSEHNLSKLHFITATKIGSKHVKGLIKENLNRDNIELGQLLVKAINLINENLLKKYNPDFDKGLFILDTFFLELGTRISEINELESLLKQTVKKTRSLQAKLNRVTKTFLYKIWRFIILLSRKFCKALNVFK